jgi:pilus assembly protein CpaE
MNPMVANDRLKLSMQERPVSGEPLSVAGICLDEETSRFINIFTASNPMLRLQSQVGSYCGDQDPETYFGQLGHSAPDVCLLDFDKNQRAAVITAERLHTSLPETAIFAVSSQGQPTAILEAMRCGCSEYLVKPIDREQLVNALIRIGARRKEKLEQNRAQLLAFMGAKGGCGVTTLATQLGALLASSFSRSTLLLDLHPDFGDAALYLKLTKSRYHFFELLENTDRIDADFLQSFLMRHSSGLELIPAPEGSMGTRDAVPAGALVSTLNFLRSRYEFILVDLPPSLNDDNLAAIQACDQLYLVSVAEVSAVRNVVRQLEYLNRKDIAREKVRVVLNRHHARNVVSDTQIEKVIEQKIFWRVPNQYPEVVKTIHEGDPVSQLSSSEVTRSLEAWASEIGKKPGTELKKKTGGGLLSFWNR